MRTNFYICRGNRDKYFDWRLKAVKFNTKQKKGKEKKNQTEEVSLILLCKIQDNIANANWITLDFQRNFILQND